MKTFSTLLATLALSAAPASYAADASDFAEALLSISPIQISYTESLQTTGLAPQSLNELGVDESYLYSNLIEHADIDPDSGAIMVGLSPDFGQNEWIALIPKIENFNVSSWTCQTTLGPALAADSGCGADVSYDHITSVVDANLFKTTLNYVNSIRVNVNEIYVAEGRFPKNMDELGIDEDWLENAHVDHVVAKNRRNAILFGLSDIYGPNEWLVYDAISGRNGQIRWRCRTSLPAELANVQGCRDEVPLEKLVR